MLLHALRANGTDAKAKWRGHPISTSTASGCAAALAALAATMALAMRETQQQKRALQCGGASECVKTSSRALRRNERNLCCTTRRRKFVVWRTTRLS